MNGAEVVFGMVLMVAGVALITVAVFRVLGHAWNHGLYEMWVFPSAGIAFVLLGHWLMT